MIYHIEHILNFLEEETLNNDVYPEIDIYANLRIEGDDFHDLMAKYGEIYEVNMSNYHWYFHAGEERFFLSLGAWLFPPPDISVKRIPITPVMLLEFANSGRWEVEYPEHVLPKHRYDIILDWVFFGSIAAFFIWAIMKGYI